MYTDLKSVQILISLLKKYNISSIVIAPGTRHMPFVHSVENDSFFSCYSITDERSAGYFALGLIQESDNPVAICCTSGTAVINILPSANEARYQRLPLLILTADRDQNLLDQYQDQMAPTHELYSVVCKKSTILPFINSESDKWRCILSINKILSELEHNLPGPVNIIFQVRETDVFNFNTSALPVIKKIKRFSFEEIGKNKIEIIQKLKSANQILVICGQHPPFSPDEIQAIENFASKYNCVFLKDNLANLHSKVAINACNALALAAPDSLRKLAPDIVITFGGHTIANYSRVICEAPTELEHWLININGEYIDPYNKLENIFECGSHHFFTTFTAENVVPFRQNQYQEKWNDINNNFSIPDFAFSDIYAVQKLLKNIPINSLLHISNSISIRYSQFFHCHESIKISCNRGCNGIDGSMSTFIGASAASEQICFLLIGDLSFFYDMNALWNRHIGNNIRILLNNNFGGMIFNSHNYWRPYTGVNKHIAAEHDATAKSWCKSRGFQYLSASSESELNSFFPEFMKSKSDSPIILEVFTGKKQNDRIFTDFIKRQREITPERVLSHFKSKVSKLILSN